MRLKTYCIIPAIAIALAAVVSGNLSAAARKKARPPAYITLEFRNVEIREFLARMSEITGKNIVFDERITGRIAIFPARRVPVNEAFSFMASVLEYRGYAVVECGDFFKVLPIDEAARKNATIIIDRSR